MRILFVIPKMTNGGAERVVANLSNYFCRNNNKVRIVAIASKESFYDLDKRIEFYGQNLSINRKNLFSTLWSYIKNFSRSNKFVKDNIEDFMPDCVVSFLFETDILTYFALRKDHKVVRVFSERNDPTRRGFAKRLILKKIYKSSDLFVCQGKKIYDYYSFIPKEKKIIIPNPLDLERIPKPVLVEKNKNIVSVGRLFKQKNFELLIRCFINSAEELPDDCNLIIYGEGPMRKSLQAIIDDNDMGKRILLAGANNDVLNKIKESALFVLPSDYEGFPNALIEAMAVGLPVISTDFYTGIARELIGKDNGIIVPVNDERKMTDAITRIMKDSLKRNKIRRNNILVREKYNAENVNILWTKNINSIMKKNNRYGKKGFDDGKK